MSACELAERLPRDRLAALDAIRCAAANLALSAGDYHAALVSSQAAFDAADHDAWTIMTIEHSTIVAMCLVLIGEPGRALDVVSRRDEYALDYYDGSEIRALAHLALGGMDEAHGSVKAHARRAATGRDETRSGAADVQRTVRGSTTAGRRIADVGTVHSRFLVCSRCHVRWWAQHPSLRLSRSVGPPFSQ
jgi:hypothetical protein